MKLLLASHGHNLTEREDIAEEGELLMEQGVMAERILLLMEGTVAAQLRQGENEPHILAIVEAEWVAGETDSSAMEFTPLMCTSSIALQN